MNYCKTHNRFTSGSCSPCEARAERDRERIPYRLENPQAWPRCHNCWSLSPVCTCDGGFGFGTGPGLSDELNFDVEEAVERMIERLRFEESAR